MTILNLLQILRFIQRGCWSSIKQISSPHQDVTCYRHDIPENCSHGIKQQSLTFKDR
jgi:hypothetical protein